MSSPVLNKIEYLNPLYLERRLPAEGKWRVKKGDKVESFTVIGEARYCREVIKIKLPGPPLTAVKEKVLAGEELVARRGILPARDRYRAPFSGVVLAWDQESSELTLGKGEGDFKLVAGASGVVTQITERSALIASRGLQIKSTFFFGETPESGRADGGCPEGELLVLGGHANELTDELVTPEVAGKIVVAGFLRKEGYAKAKAMGARGLVVGSLDQSLYSILKNPEVAVLVHEGFGKIPFNPIVFAYLKKAAPRYVLLLPTLESLIVPDEKAPDWYQPLGPTAALEKYQVVQVFARPYFGFIGTVSKLAGKTDPVEVDLWEVEKKIKINPEDLAILPVKKI